MLQQTFLNLKNTDLKSSPHTLGLYIKMHTLAVCREGNVLYVQPIATCSISLLGSIILNMHIIKSQSKPGYKGAFNFIHSAIKT